MITFNDLTTEELTYLRSKWTSEVPELTKERGAKQKRLNDRLSRTAEDAAAKTELETSLQEMQAVLTELQNNGSPAAVVATIQTQVNNLQAEIDSFGSGSTHVSNTDAMLYQLELEELDSIKTLRSNKIAEIDTVLGT